MRAPAATPTRTAMHLLHNHPLWCQHTVGISYSIPQHTWACTFTSVPHHPVQEAVKGKSRFVRWMSSRQKWFPDSAYISKCLFEVQFWGDNLVLLCSYLNMFRVLFFFNSKVSCFQHRVVFPNNPNRHVLWPDCLSSFNTYLPKGLVAFPNQRPYCLRGKLKYRKLQFWKDRFCNFYQDV